MREIKLQSEVVLDDGQTYVVVEHAGSNVKLHNTLTGEHFVITLSHLVLRLAEPPAMSSWPVRGLDGLSHGEYESTRILSAHLEEVIYGTPLISGGARRPEFDPELASLGKRVERKSDELTTLGLGMSTRSLRRKVSAYRQAGPAALVDQRSTRVFKALDSVDPRLLAAIKLLQGKTTNATTRTHDHFVHHLKEYLHKKYPEDYPAKLPSDNTLRRYKNALGSGKYIHGKSSNRRSAAVAPDHVFGGRVAIKAGHEVQVDSSPWDIIALDDTGTPRKAQLTIMIDKKTRGLPASAVTIGGVKGLDIALMLARCVTPRHIRPDNVYLNTHNLPEMPWARLLSKEDMEKYDTSRPLIKPNRIMIDNGADYKSLVVLSVCQSLGISRTEASVRTGSDKAIVERAFETIKTRFAQYLPGYTGGDLSERGLDPQNDSDLLDIHTLAELFDRWITVVWQNLPAEGLRDPAVPGLQMSPNAMYMAMFDVSGCISLPLRLDEYIALLPIEYRTIGTDGIVIGYRKYDSAELQPFRLMRTADRGHSGKWAVRVDPYNPSTVWVAHPDDGEWIPCAWKNADAFKQPFNRTVRREAKRISSEMGFYDVPEAVALTTEIIGRTKSVRAQALAEEARNRAAAQRLVDSGLTPPIRQQKLPNRRLHTNDDPATESTFLEIGAFDPEENLR